jgi:hypothetical protein
MNLKLSDSANVAPEAASPIDFPLATIEHIGYGEPVV